MSIHRVAADVAPGGLKRGIAELAVFGGRPVFEAPIHVGAPNIGRRERFFDYVNAMLDARRLTNGGPLLESFERDVAARLGVRHCVATCNGTLALDLALRAAGVSGEVILPSFTFVATAHALSWQGIEPVFCDVEPDSFNIDPRRVESLITARTGAILGVHLWGRPCAIEALQDIAARHGLALLFDAAHAFGCTHRGRSVGGFGDAEIFSFHATKVLNSFEGGAVVTNRDDVARRVRSMRNFGFAGYDDVQGLGTNAKMSEASAAMGLTNLASLEEFIAHNRANFAHYRAGLADVAGVALAPVDGDEQRNYHYVVADVDGDVAGLTRDALVEVLWAENVHARRYFSPGCHRLRPYRRRCEGSAFPVTDRAAARTLCLPTGSAVDTQDVARICALIRFCVEHARDITRRLRAGGATPAHDGAAHA